MSDATANRPTAISAPAAAAVCLALVGLAGAAIVAAVVPGRDPLGLPERRRTAYVYGAEGLLALAVLNARLALPWLFAGWLVRFGPLAVVALAFLGVGLSELFRRQGRPVLAVPLERTGALLPVLPLLGSLWWGQRPGDGIVFFVMAGGLYTTLAMSRSSAGFGALAVLAYNAALWALLGRYPGLALGVHPQLWVIPPALCVLIAAHLNRGRLAPSQDAAIRYAATLAIYLASTADILLAGVAEAPWLPLILAGLSLAGIFAGILLRIRGFLFLGLGFLVLALWTIVWYAAVDLRQTWIWAACGILTGLAILAVFALLETKREELLGLIDRLKGWEP